MQLKLEDFLSEGPCPYCKDGKAHEGEVVLYTTPDGGWACLADKRLYRCERGLEERLPTMKRLLEQARAKGLQAFAVESLIEGSRKPIRIYTMDIRVNEEEIEWPEEFRKRILIVEFGWLRTLEWAVERLELMHRECCAHVDQEALKRVLESEGHES
jgi:hypothetical protein